MENVQECLDEAATLAKAEAPFSGEVKCSMRIIAKSVGSMTKQLAQISGVAIAASSQSLVEIGQSLQNAG